MVRNFQKFYNCIEVFNNIHDFVEFLCVMLVVLNDDNDYSLFMKKCLFIMLLACTLIACQQQKKEPTVQEQLALIDSLVSSNNNPLTIDSYRICPIEGSLELTANSIEYNGEKLSFFIFQEHSDQVSKSSAILLPSEISRFSQIVDSISTLTSKELNYNKSVVFSTTGGLNIIVNNTPGEGWGIMMKPSAKSEYAIGTHANTLKWLSEILNNSVNEDKQMKPIDELSQFVLPVSDQEKPFFAKLDKEQGVERTQSGLRYKIITKTEGKKPTGEDRVTIAYRMTNTEGTEIDKSKPTITVPAYAMISGIVEGLKLMSVGSKYIFYIPSYLGYGSRETGPIPPFSALIFEVELKSIER